MTEVQYASAEELERKLRSRWLPPPRLKVSEFADEHLIVTSGPQAPGRWQTSFMPYQAGILDAFFEPGIEIVVLQASSQVGKTSAAAVMVAYHIVHDPCSILVVEPTVDPMAKDFSKNRLEPMIAASPVLTEAVSKKRAKDSSNTLLAKTFKGGSLAIGGANSAASLAARTVRLLVLDEIDRYPPELPGEGATIQIAMKRTAAYRGRRRIMLLSSPTLKGAPIDSYYHRGDQRRYYVPCPACGYMAPMRWANIRWTDRDASTARLHCPECDYGIDDDERVAILNQGEWRAENQGRRESEIASFHLWEAYSPLSSLASIVSGFLAARDAQKTGDKSLMHTWQNTTLGEAIEPEIGEGVESHVLLSRRESYGDADVPEGVVCVTRGVDTQDNRLEVLDVGWGAGEESWLLDHHILAGDTGKPVKGAGEATPWSELAKLLDATYLHPSGHSLSVSATCIDSAGHRTDRVYDFAALHAARRVFAVIGRDGNRPIVSAPSPRKYGRSSRRCMLYTVGVDAAKAILMGRLKNDEQGEGYIHVPDTDWFDDELAKQITSERLVTKFTKGIPVQRWEQTRARNEGLDLFVYALAALRLAHPNLRLLARQLSRPASSTHQAPPKPKPRNQSSWLGPQRNDWFDRG